MCLSRERTPAATNFSSRDKHDVSCPLSHETRHGIRRIVATRLVELEIGSPLINETRQGFGKIVPTLLAELKIGPPLINKPSHRANRRVGSPDDGGCDGDLRPPVLSIRNTKRFTKLERGTTCS